MAAAEFTPGLGLSADAIPQASVLWDCNPDGCFTNGCAGSAELWTKDSDVFWWDDLDEYEAWTNSCDRDYDYDQTNPDNLVTSVRPTAASGLAAQSPVGARVPAPVAARTATKKHLAYNAIVRKPAACQYVAPTRTRRR